MPKTHLKKRIRHTPNDLLTLVTDVESYPDFINFVSAVRIFDRENIGEQKEQFKADVGIQYKFVSERFRSIVDVDRQAKTLNIGRAGHGGAVRALTNSWKFIELSDGSSLIDFELAVKMKAAPLEFLIRQKFEKAVHHIVNVFEVRAGQIYPLIGDEDFDIANEKVSIS